MSQHGSAPVERPLAPDILNALRYYLGGRRGLIVLAVVAVGGGLALNWSWLVAVGVAPLLITAAPCIAMCALGLCMHKMSQGNSQTTDSAAARPSDVDLSWMRRQDLAAALPPVAARDDAPKMPSSAAANDSRPIATAACCSSTTERS